MFGSSLAKATKYIATKIKTFEKNVPFEDEDLLNLISYHPTRKNKSVISFVRKARPPFYRVSLYAITKTGTVYEASITKCLRNMYGKFDTEKEKRKTVIQAFRSEANLSSEMIKAKAALTIGPCSDCGKLCKLCVDHKDKPFSQLLDEFLASHALKLKDIKTRWVQGSEYLLDDKKLGKQWHEFHDTNATFQGLCRQCNSSKGSSGYKIQA